MNFRIAMRRVPVREIATVILLCATDAYAVEARLPSRGDRRPTRAAVAGDLSNPNDIDSAGRTALHRACGGGELDNARALIEDGADVDVVDRTGATPLSYAIRAGSVDVVKLLLAHGGGVNAADSRGQTPLMGAAWAGRPEIVEVLLEAGADLKSADNHQMTALHYAFANDRSATAQMLIEHGAELSARNAQGKTPIDFGPSLNLNLPPLLLAERRAGIARDNAGRIHLSRDRGPAWNFLQIAGGVKEGRILGISIQKRTAINEIISECERHEKDLPLYGPRPRTRRTYIAKRNKVWEDALPGAKAQLTAEQVKKVEAYVRDRQVQQMAHLEKLQAQAVVRDMIDRPADSSE